MAARPRTQLRATRAPLVAAFVAAAALAATPAEAQPMLETVHLTDGSTYQGELVEKVPDDHVILRLATGEIKRFDWAQISSAHDEVPAPPREPSQGNPAPPLPPPPVGPFVSGSDGPLVDWPEPNRTPSAMMASRLSVGLVGGLSPIGYGAVAAEYYPWSGNGFTIGLHAAFGPAGAIGPSVAEMLTFDWPLMPGIQQGIGVGLTQSFGQVVGEGSGTQTALFLDADCSHIAWYLTRELMLRLTGGFSFPIGGPCGGGIGNGCGRWTVGVPLLVTGGLFWNFDMSSEN